MKWDLDFWRHLIITAGDYADYEDVADVYNTLMAILCVICAGLAAGLTIGLLSLDITKLEIKMMTGSEAEKQAAAKILPIVQQHHLLLVTLLLFNSLANETLPIFLGAIVPNYLAVVISVTLVLIFGEIIPSAIFTGPSQLLTAAKLTGLVYFLFALFYPIAYPLSKVLDYFFGTEEATGDISRSELEALVILQGTQHKKLTRENTMLKSPATKKRNGHHHHDHDVEKNESRQDNDVDGLTAHEVSLMTGILKLSKLAVKDAMIPIQKVCMISSHTTLNTKSLFDILDSGFSRIPVYRKADNQHLAGYMLVKELIVVDPSENMLVNDTCIREPLFVKPDLGLMEMLGIFQQGQCHIALVSADPILSLDCMRSGSRPTGNAVALGLVTMEDVLEKIIQSDIMDETDSHHNPRIYPNGGAPTMFYHHLRRNGRRVSSPGAGLDVGYDSANNRRKSGPRIPYSGSVISAEYYSNANHGHKKISHRTSNKRWSESMIKRNDSDDNMRPNRSYYQLGDDEDDSSSNDDVKFKKTKSKAEIQKLRNQTHSIEQDKINESIVQSDYAADLVLLEEPGEKTRLIPK